MCGFELQAFAADADCLGTKGLLAEGMKVVDGGLPPGSHRALEAGLVPD